MGLGQRPISKLVSLLWVGVGAILLVLSAQSWAGEEGPEFTLRAFGTLGVMRSSSDKAEYSRDLSQKFGSGGSWTGRVDSLLGVQANLRIQDQAEAVVQVASRQHDDGSFDPTLEWGFIRLDLTPSTSLRLGRIGTDFYQDADSRLVGYANLVVRPSPDVFGTMPFFHIDGVDAVTTRSLGEGVLQGKLFAGLVEEKAPYGNQLWDMGGSLIAGGHLDYHEGPWSLRVGYALLRLEHELPPYETLLPLLRAAGAGGLADELSLAGKRSDFLALSLTYEKGPWRIQGMLTHIQQETLSYNDVDAGYVLAGYRFGSLTPFAGVSFSRGRHQYRDTSALPAPLRAAADDALSFAHTDQATWTLGMRWDVRRNLDAKLQWDWVRGKPDSLLLTHNEKPGWNGRTNVLSLTLDFVF
jgi:hypothetical protein